MKVVLISDTHGLHNSIRVPNGDVLIHAGDLSPSGTDSEISEAARWFGALPHRHKIVIAGNHDWLFERQPSRASALLRSAGVIYLEDSGTSVDGLTIYGSPRQPEFMHWAFNVPRGRLTRYWRHIPHGLDILITHGPPYGILDQRVSPSMRRVAPWEDEEPFGGSDHVGDEELLVAVEIAKPQVHVFGHIHGSYGRTQNNDTTCLNAAICNENYEPIHEPWVTDVLPRKVE